MKTKKKDGITLNIVSEDSVECVCGVIIRNNDGGITRHIKSADHTRKLKQKQQQSKIKKIDSFFSTQPSTNHKNDDDKKNHHNHIQNDIIFFVNL